MLDDCPPAKRLKLIEGMTTERECVIFGSRERTETAEEEPDSFFELSKRDALRIQQVRFTGVCITQMSHLRCSHVNGRSYAIGR